MTADTSRDKSEGPGDFGAKFKTLEDISLFL